jgi:hypothetical protein
MTPIVTSVLMYSSIRRTIRIYQDQSEQHLVLRDGNDDQDGMVEYVDRGATMTGAVVV